MEKGGGDAAPTGCYKCGRPGHWSRDCLSDNYASKTGGGGALEPIVGKSTKKPKKIPKTRPKLTPELLLSNDGLGYVLRHFPRSLKHRGRGQESKGEWIRTRKAARTRKQQGQPELALGPVLPIFWDLRGGAGTQTWARPIATILPRPKQVKARPCLLGWLDVRLGGSYRHVKDWLGNVALNLQTLEEHVLRRA
ncbi:hypothetical protein RJ639_028408 [Escallonia herrerae]|uniref:CCHC-type domain-containing protein n=1 Tax=Escallonia herrerae TaxID=1293975 RepID=A0AA88X595_9ASTE|nr:hypothetical protein RJ639_028408 [Escallonia herrerae]